MTEYVICPTTGKKLNPNTLIPIEDSVSFKDKTTQGETHLQCQGFDGPCDSVKAVTQRQRTNYVDDDRNWVTMCDECAEENAKHWDQMWADYYSGRI